MAGWINSEAHQRVVGVLRAAREEAGVTQAELAARIGKVQSYISKLEQAQRRIGVLELYAIAHALGVDPVALFARSVKGLPRSVDF